MASKTNTMTTITAEIARKATSSAIALTGLPNEPFRNVGARNNYNNVSLPITTRQSDMLRNTFDLELASINTERRRQGLQPLVNVNSLNAHLTTPFMADITRAIETVMRTATLNDTIPVEPVEQVIAIGIEVRTRPEFDADMDIGIPAELTGLRGVVIEQSYEDWRVEFPDHGPESFWINETYLEVLTP